MWITAIILGFAGSLHCIGMCSPLVMAVTSFNSRVLTNKLLYNSGRLFSYAILGALVTVFGVMIKFSQFQFVITLSLAIALIVMGLSGISGMRIPFVTPMLIRFSNKVKVWFSKFLKQRSFSGLFITGMLNGILPCGLTYFALTYCLTLAGPWDGFQFMLLFGLGTLPAMLGLTSVISYLVRRFQLNVSAITRYSFIIIGAIVLARLYFSQQHVISQAGEQIGIILCR